LGWSNAFKALFCKEGARRAGVLKKGDDVMTEFIEKTQALGAESAVVVEVADIPFEPALIDLCVMNTCGNYGKSWVCPPLVGKTSDLIAEAKSYSKMLVFHAIYRLEDSFDIEGMFAANEGFHKLTNEVDEVFNGVPHVTLSAGGCKICETCAAVTDEPCRVPEKAFVSVEAYGIFVSKLAEVAGVKYINGVNTVTYFGGVLFD